MIVECRFGQGVCCFKSKLVQVGGKREIERDTFTVNRFEEQNRVEKQILLASKRRAQNGGDTPVPPPTFRKANDDVTYLSNVDRVLCLSDLHTDHVDNLAWLANRTQQDDNLLLQSSDLIVVAGDISHDLERMEESFDLMLRTGASVLFVAGNHEAWLSSVDLKGLRLPPFPCHERKVDLEVNHGIMLHYQLITRSM